MLRKSKLGLMEASGCLGHGLELFCLGFVGGVLGLCEVDGKADARRERISAWAGTPSGIQLWLREVDGKADARGRGYRPGQGLRWGIQLRFREMAKSIAAGPELACGSDS